jgi:hypothetical protein
MSILAKVGERTYEFQSQLDIEDAREIYASFTGGQNDLESEFEEAGIEFFVEANP